MKINYFDVNKSSMSNYAIGIICEILLKEGEQFTDHPNDWPTKWGIRRLSADRAGYDGRIEDIDRELAFQIWTSLFWYGSNLYLIEAVSELIAKTVVDTSGPAGLRVGITHLQEALTSFNMRKNNSDQNIYGVDLVADGIMGPKTLIQLEGFLAHRKMQDGESVLATRLNCLQDAHYTKIALRLPKKRVFSFGWSSQRVHADLVDLLNETETMVV